VVRVRSNPLWIRGRTFPLAQLISLGRRSRNATRTRDATQRISLSTSFAAGSRAFLALFRNRARCTVSLATRRPTLAAIRSASSRGGLLAAHDLSLSELAFSVFFRGSGCGTSSCWSTSQVNGGAAQGLRGVRRVRVARTVARARSRYFDCTMRLLSRCCSASRRPR